MWGNNDFKWKIGERPGGQAMADLTGDKNNEMDSWANRSAAYVGGMFDDWGGTGDCLTMNAVDNDSNVAPWHSDQVSSWRTRYGC